MYLHMYIYIYMYTPQSTVHPIRKTQLSYRSGLGSHLKIVFTEYNYNVSAGGKQLTAGSSATQYHDDVVRI